MDGTKNMLQLVVEIGLLLGLWILVLSILLGLLDVVLSHYGDTGTRLLGVAIGIATLIPSFVLALALSPLLLEKITTSFDGNPNVN